MWKKVWTALPYFALYTAAVAVIGLVNLITVTGGYKFWEDPMWWNRTVSQNVANLLVLTATIMLYLAKQRGENEDYLQLKSTVDTQVRHMDADFGEWHFEENKRIKTKAYIHKIQRKINAKEHRAKTNDLRVWFEGTAEEKAKNRYCIKRMRMEDSIKPERLEKRIMSIKIDYDRIDRNFVETGEERTIEKQNQKLDSTARKVYDNAPRVMFGISFAAFFNAFLYDFIEQDQTFWLRFAFGLGVLVWMFIQGKMYAVTYMTRILMVDLNTRFNIIKNYLTWKLSKKKEVNNG